MTISQSAPKASRDVLVDLEARQSTWAFAPGRTVTGWAFNGQVPGPTIEARVGDTLVVRLRNSLSEPTTIHWHGVRVPAGMDGTEVSQRAVQPGATYEYRFVVPDAGTFWYHSHSNETEQMERGMYGALIVRGDDEPVVDGEQLFVLDDLKLKRSGELADFGGLIERHNGREGNVRLVNGKVDPELSIAAGQIERWRFVNAANARYVVLSLGGRRFKIVASSGGLIDAPYETSAVLLTPGDRVDIAVGPFDEGETVPVESLPYFRLAGLPRRAAFASVRVKAAKESRALVPDRMRAIEPLARFDAIPMRQIELSARPSLRNVIDLVINGKAHGTDAPVTVGELQIWEVINKSPMDHPFHLHGFFFQILAVDGIAPVYRSWEDTVNIGGNSRVVIAWMPDDRPGMWMYHCHILEHHAAGMMASFAVVRPPGVVAAAHQEKRSSFDV